MKYLSYNEYIDTMVRSMSVLRGVVRDRESNSIVPWLAVSLDGQSCVTDKNGMFIFRSISVGKHMLSVRSLFYRPITKPVDVNESMTSIEILVDRGTL